MRVKHSCTQLLVAAIGCLPATIQPAAVPDQESRQPATVDFPCTATQPDLSIGSVVYLKGRATLNGAVPIGKRTPLRHGDRVTTAHDAFMAVELLDGSLVNIPPATSLRAHCTATAPASNNADAQYIVTGAHMSGGIRG